MPILHQASNTGLGNEYESTEEIKTLYEDDK